MLGSSGLSNWRIQRLTAIFLGLYVIFLTVFLLRHTPLAFEQWSGLFMHPWMQISTLFALVCVALHAWVGLEIVLTDYVKPFLLRYVLLGVILLALFSYVIWGVMILWE